MKVTRNYALMALGAAASLLPQNYAGSFTANFNDNATPAGTYLNGQAGGGVIQNGVLKITTTSGSETGGFIIEDLDAGAPVYGFTFTAKVRVDSAGTPADGFSLNFAPDISELTGASGGEFEDGVGSGLRIAFDTYSNAGEFPPSPSIALRVGNNVIRYVQRPAAQIMTGATFADLSLVVTPAGAVTLTYQGEKIFDNVYFPGYQAVSGGRFAIAGRTGGAVENVWLDDINLTTITTPQVGVATDPATQTVLTGNNVTFAPVLNNVEGATFQWLRNGVPLSGATDQTLTLSNVGLADSGTKYSLRITGPNNTVTTAEATLNVVDIPLPAATASYDFTTTDGTAPAGTSLFGGNTDVNGILPPGGYITFEGDASGFPAGALHLTDNVNSQYGGIIVEDLVAGSPVYGITAHFKVHVDSGSDVPADGFSFNFANDIPDAPGALEFENGVGTGLTVGFDIYDNGGGEAPSIDVRYGGSLIAQQLVPLSFIETGDNFADVIIRLENDGTLDVVYKGVVVFNNLFIPGFNSITGGRVLIAGRTGGLNEQMWVDDLALTPLTTAGDLHIITQPLNKYVVAGQSVTLSTAVNDETGVTYQWYKNGAVISGATSAQYTFNAAAADTGAQYTVKTTRGGLSATSNSATLTVLTITPTVSYDFNSATTAPAGTVLTGTDENNDNPVAYITANGGVDDSGVLHLTDSFNGQRAAFIVEPVLGGAEVAAINVAFDVRIGGGTQPPADGMSFNWASDLPDTIPNVDLENGAGTGLTIAFDIFDNGGGEGPSIDIKWKGNTLIQTKLTSAEIQTDVNGEPTFRKVIIKVTADGKVDVVYGDRIIYSGYQLPNYAPITNGKFAFYARTGGLNGNQWLDNIQIQAIKSTAPLRIATQPANVLLFPGSTATFSVVVSDPVGATYQWYRNGAPISGATSASYTTPALTLADNGASYTLTATGPGGTATSTAAVATVVSPIAPITNPDVSFDFNASTDTPEGTTLYGSIDTNPANPDPGVAGYITPTGGVNDSGVLHLTDANNGQGGTFYIRNFDGDQAVSAFTANWKMRIGGGSPTPADGASFSWASDLNPDSGLIFGENGGGAGLVISFDIYHNDGENAPEFEIVWQGSSVAQRSVPIDWLTTDSDFADVFVRLEADGTVDVQYEGRPIFSNVQLPNFQPQVGANFAIGARTGGLNANQWIDDVKIVTTSGAVGATVNIAQTGTGTLTITWAGGGTLETAASITGPWTPLTGQTSPVTVTPTESMRFYRVAQ